MQKAYHICEAVYRFRLFISTLDRLTFASRTIGPARRNTMKKQRARILTTLPLAAVGSVGAAQTSDSQITLVTVENYNRAQTDVNFSGVVKNGGFGKFRHGRELAPPVQQGIVRPNRDTLYSFAVVDLDAGPAAITLPEAPVKHLIGTAMLWGGNPERDALYLPITPARNDGNTILAQPES